MMTLRNLLEFWNRFDAQDHQEKARDRARDSAAFRQAVVSGEAGLPAQSSDGPQIGTKVQQKLDLNKAKKYAPPQSQLHHCPFSERIRGFCMWLDHRPSHGCSLSFSQDVACRVVLEWLWMMWRQSHPEQPIPFEFPYELVP